MDEIPDEMLTKGRAPIHDFAPNERLYRRIRPEDIEASRPTIRAFDMPDMSCNRSTLCEADWAIFDEAFRDWGVLAFSVADIPKQQTFQGVLTYTFAPAHVPLKYNWPHSEVQAFLDGQHISIKESHRLDPQANLQWRQKLLWNANIVIFPTATR